MARPTIEPTARPSFPAFRTEALCFVFFIFALTRWLALEAALVADLVNDFGYAGTNAGSSHFGSSLDPILIPRSSQ